MIRVMHRSRILLFACSILLPAGLSGSMDPSMSDTTAPVDWTERLEALEPARALEYFELAEEVSETASSVEERELARQLFGLAGLLDEKLSCSAALAIAGMPGMEQRRNVQERLRAAAELLAPSGTIVLGASRKSGISEQDRIMLCRALGMLRRGDGYRAGRAFEEQGVVDALEEVGFLFNGGANRVREDCSIYRGGLRPDLSAEGIRSHLIAEIITLAPGSPGWGIELLRSDAAPLTVVDLERLDLLFGVDPARPYWRGGAWVGAQDARRGY